MEKEEGNVQDPLKFRVLKILPTLYRRWAAARLMALGWWIEGLSTEDIYDGADPIGILGATYGIGIEIEEMGLGVGASLGRP